MVKYPWSRRDPAPPKPKGRFRSFIWRRLQGVSVGLMVTVLLAFVLYPYMLVTVPSGEVGVLWKRFSGPGIYCWCILPRGTVLNPVEIRNEGLHIIWPWDRLFIYDLRLQATTEKYNAISRDGVTVTAEINIRYQLLHDSVAVFHKFIGPSFIKSLLSPEIGSQARKIISQYTAQEVYVSRAKIEEQIKAAAQASLGEHLNSLFQSEASEQFDAPAYKNALQSSIQVLDTFVLSIVLPPAIVAAINRQTEQFYQIQEYRYRVEREAEESKRKLIEANGIAAFQRIVSQGISDSYLRWRGIEATLALSQSQNTKIVIIGNSKDGLPIILGNMDTAQQPNPQLNQPANKSPLSNLPLNTPSSNFPQDNSTLNPSRNPAPAQSQKPSRDVTSPAADTPPAGPGGQSQQKPQTTSPTNDKPAADQKKSQTPTAAPTAQPDVTNRNSSLNWSDILSRLTGTK
jgi:regulator of protease activity HflC (stomatin/prohibitin superfamily)